MTTSIFVDSRFAKIGTDSNFQIELRESVSFSESARLRVDKIRFIDSFFTTDAGNYLYFKNGDSFTTIAIPEMPYSGTRLAAVIQSMTGKTSIYYESTNGMSIAYDENTRILSDEEISQLEGPFPPGASREHPRSLNRILGPFHIESGNQNFPFVCMQPFTDVYLRSRRLTCNNMHAPDDSHNVLCKIPLSEGVGKTVVSSTPDNVYYNLGALTFRSMDFQLTDEFGNPVNLRGRPLSFQIIIDE